MCLDVVVDVAAADEDLTTLSDLLLRCSVLRKTEDLERAGLESQQILHQKLKRQCLHPP
jgi:hypothetical protein